MNVEAIVILSLVALNIFQLVHWSRTTQRLIDKLMSKNYAEYVQSENLKASLPMPKLTDSLSREEENDLLREINGMLPT